MEKNIWMGFRIDEKAEEKVLWIWIQISWNYPIWKKQKHLKNKEQKDPRKKSQENKGKMYSWIAFEDSIHMQDLINSIEFLDSPQLVNCLMATVSPIRMASKRPHFLDEQLNLGLLSTSFQAHEW